jgi:hypothetical protein
MFKLRHVSVIQDRLQGCAILNTTLQLIYTQRIKDLNYLSDKCLTSLYEF